MTEIEMETESKKRKICSGDEAAMEEEGHVESDELGSIDILDELDEEERKKKSVYICMWKAPDEELKVISSNPHQGILDELDEEERRKKGGMNRFTLLNDATSKVKEKVCELEHLRIWGYSIAVLDSKLYFIGGHLPLPPNTETEYYIPSEVTLSNKVYVYDTISCEWSSAPSMNVARAFPTVLTYKKKIFAFGLSMCFYNVDSPLPAEEWAEFYDPKFGEWQYLPGTPPEALRRRSYTTPAVDEQQEKVRLCVQGEAVYEYSFQSREWSKMRADAFFHSHRYWSDTVAVVNSVLFWHYFGNIYAYDFKRSGLPIHIYTVPDAVKTFGVPTHGDNDPITSSHLVHAGSGKLCLLYKSLFDPERIARFHTFELRRSRTTKEPTLQPLGVQTFSIGDYEIAAVLTMSSS